MSTPRALQAALRPVLLATASSASPLSQTHLSSSLRKAHLLHPRETPRTSYCQTQKAGDLSPTQSFCHLGQKRPSLDPRPRPPPGLRVLTTEDGSPSSCSQPAVPPINSQGRPRFYHLEKNKPNPTPQDSLTPGPCAPHSHRPRTFHAELSSQTPLCPESCPLHLHNCPCQVSPGHLVPKPYRPPQA